MAQQTTTSEVALFAAARPACDRQLSSSSFSKQPLPEIGTVLRATLICLVSPLGLIIHSLLICPCNVVGGLIRSGNPLVLVIRTEEADWSSLVMTVM